MCLRFVKICLIALLVLSVLVACSGAEPQPPPTRLPSPTAALATSTAEPTITPTEPPPPPATPLAPSQVNWWNQAPFYQIFVRSFSDSDGDGNGDFQGITQKLDYLNDGDSSTTSDLGVEGIWLMPIFPSPSYHGYDVTDYYTTNPDYGTLEDFKELVEEAHKRGIKVIIDFVLNHTSNQHPWFSEAQKPDSPYRDWYVWVDKHPGYMGPWNQGVWHYGPNDTYYYGIFSPVMPDLNYNNPEVVAEMEKVAQFWLDEVGVDGFRLDGARHIVEEGKNQADTPSTHQYYEGFRQFVKGVDPEAMILGEVWTNDVTVGSYLQGDQLDLAFDFDLASAFLTSAEEGDSYAARNQLLLSQRTLPSNQYSPFLTNHDMDRTYSRLDNDVNKSKVAAAMLLTGPGAPFIYYGEEVGMQGSRGGANSDEARRRPMQWSAGENAGFTTGKPWTAINSDYAEMNVAVQEKDPGSLLSLYRTLSQLRSAYPALSVGETYVPKGSAEPVYAVLRHRDGQAILVVINLSDEVVEDYTLDLTSGPLQGAYRAEALYGEGAFADLTANPQGGFDAYKPLPSLSPYGILVLQLTPSDG